MTYRIVHRTTYKYRYPVSLGNHVACLTPRTLRHHRLARKEMSIHPAPATLTERHDYFGNLLCFFTVQEPHRELVVEARSEVILDKTPSPVLQANIPWEEVVNNLALDHSPEGMEA
jgi:transglutaminase-like putative cysteine protease